MFFTLCFLLLGIMGQVQAKMDQVDTRLLQRSMLHGRGIHDVPGGLDHPELGDDEEEDYTYYR